MEDEALARSVTSKLREGLSREYELVDLDQLEPIHETSAADYWTDCPEKVVCLQLLGENGGVAMAFLGELRVREVPVEEVQRAESMDTKVFTLHVVDVARDTAFTPRTVEIVGDDIGPLLEAVTLLLDSGLREGRRHHRGRQERDSAPEREELEGLLEGGEEIQREHELPEPGSLWPLEEGHKGQILLRLAVGGAYGELEQEYYSYQLLTDDVVSEEYARLNLIRGGEAGLGLTLGYGLTRHLEVEASFQWLGGTSSLRVYQEQAFRYGQEAWTEASCESGSTSPDLCPERIAVSSSNSFLGIQLRYYPALTRKMRPFVFAGGRLQLSSDIVEDAGGEYESSMEWWYRFDAIRTAGVAGGLGMQYDMRRSVGVFVQIPLYYRIVTNQDGAHEVHRQSGDGPFLQSLPESNTPSLPLTGGLEFGVQVRWL